MPILQDRAVRNMSYGKKMLPLHNSQKDALLVVVVDVVSLKE